MTSSEHRKAKPITEFDHTDMSVPASVVRDRYEQMLQECPVAHSDRYGGFDYISRYDDVRTVLHDPAAFTTTDGVFIPDSGLPKIPALEDDPPEHTAMRALMNGPLNPRAVRAFEPTIAQIADVLIDNFADRGTADLAPEFCALLPAIVIGRMIGLNHDEAVEVQRLAISMFNSIGTDTFEMNWSHFSAFIDRQLQMRQDAPRDDHLTALARGDINGTPVDAKLVTEIITAYLLGGHHSTATGIAGALRYILADPALTAVVAEADRAMARAIEESLRLTTPLQLFARTVRGEACLSGVQFGDGDRLMVNLAAANRDEKQFPDPERFVLDRPRNAHVAFGGGLHNCIGQHLARAELRIAVRSLLRRLPDIRLAGDVGEAGLTGGKLMAITSVPVEFTPSEHGYHAATNA